MRIVSDFHDYYDGVQRMGQDLTLVYVRREDEADAGLAPRALCRERWLLVGRSGERGIRSYTIGFCGRLVAGFEVVGAGLEGEASRFSDLAAAREAVLASAETRDDRRYYEREFAWDDRWTFREQLGARSVREWRRANADRDDEPFVRLGCPVFHVTRPERGAPPRLVKNVRLAPFGFPRIVPPWEAFQQIATYLAGPLARQNDPPQEIDDATLARAKGFDERSFRMDSPGKKRRRRS